MRPLHELRPRQFTQARNDCPVAYWGIGILEWHGLHNPLGLDGVKGDRVAHYVADRLGGVVLPPLFWGDNRRDICEVVFDDTISPWLPDGTGNHTDAICRNLDIAKPEIVENAFRSERTGGWELWERLLVHSLFEIETLGFQLVVLVPGHYPLFGPVQRATERYRSEGGHLAVFSLQDDLYGDEPGDHAAAFETSLMLALAPELVDLSELGSDVTSPPVGVLGKDPRQHASRELGIRILEKFVELTRKQYESAGIEIPG